MRDQRTIGRLAAFIVGPSRRHGRVSRCRRLRWRAVPDRHREDGRDSAYADRVSDAPPTITAFISISVAVDGVGAIVIIGPAHASSRCRPSSSSSSPPLSSPSPMPLVGSIDTVVAAAVGTADRPHRHRRSSRCRPSPAFPVLATRRRRATGCRCGGSRMWRTTRPPARPRGYAGGFWRPRFAARTPMRAPMRRPCVASPPSASSMRPTTAAAARSASRSSSGTPQHRQQRRQQQHRRRCRDRPTPAQAASAARSTPGRSRGLRQHRQRLCVDAASSSTRHRPSRALRPRRRASWRIASPRICPRRCARVVAPAHCGPPPPGIWPSEEVLAWLALRRRALFELRPSPSPASAQSAGLRRPGAAQASFVPACLRVAAQMSSRSAPA